MVADMKRCFEIKSSPNLYAYMAISDRSPGPNHRLNMVNRFLLEPSAGVGDIVLGSLVTACVSGWTSDHPHGATAWCFKVMPRLKRSRAELERRSLSELDVGGRDKCGDVSPPDAETLGVKLGVPDVLGLSTLGWSIAFFGRRFADAGGARIPTPDDLIFTSSIDAGASMVVVLTSSKIPSSDFEEARVFNGEGELGVMGDESKGVRLGEWEWSGGVGETFDCVGDSAR